MENNVIFKHVFTFGKIPFRSNRRENPVEITVEIRKCGGDGSPEYLEFSAVGAVWNRLHSDWIMGGQCLDDLIPFARYMKNRETFFRIANLWRNYHLNSMNAGTREQTAAVKAYFEKTGKSYDYKEACDYLESVGLWRVKYTGKAVGRFYNDEWYNYGHGWIVNELPVMVLTECRQLAGETE